MHEMSLVHGDVKPKNIVVSDDLRSVKIIDFGSAGGECSPTAECNTNIHVLHFYRAEGSAFPLLVDLRRFCSTLCSHTSATED